MSLKILKNTLKHRAFEFRFIHFPNKIIYQNNSIEKCAIMLLYGKSLVSFFPKFSKTVLGETQCMVGSKSRKAIAFLAKFCSD